MHDTSMPPHKSSLIPDCDDHNKAKQEERVPGGGVLHRSRTSARRAQIRRRHQAASIAPTGRTLVRICRCRLQSQADASIAADASKSPLPERG